MPALGWSNSAFVGVWRSVVVRGKAFDITLTAGKLRKVDVWGVPFMEQNKAKESKYALLARKGAK